MRYWVYIEKASYGPYEVEELRGVARFTPETLVCAENAVGGKDWVAAKEIAELKPAFDKPPEPPRKLEAAPAAPFEPKTELLAGPAKSCPSCRKDVPADSLFCNKCGARMDGLGAPPDFEEKMPAPMGKPLPMGPMAGPPMGAPPIAAAPPAAATAAAMEPPPPLAIEPTVAPMEDAATETLIVAPRPARSAARQWLLPVGVGTAAIAAIFVVMPRLMRHHAPVESVELPAPPAPARLSAPTMPVPVKPAAAPAPAAPQKPRNRYPRKIRITAKAEPTPVPARKTARVKRVKRKKKAAAAAPAPAEPDDANLAALIDGQEPAPKAEAKKPELESLLAAGANSGGVSPAGPAAKAGSLSAGQLDQLLGEAPEEGASGKPAAKAAAPQDFMLPGIPKIAPSGPAAAAPLPGGGAGKKASACSEPAFYSSLAEDPDWYYGVAQAADPASARSAAIDNLSSRVKGEIAVSFDDAEIQKLAGAGRDRVAVADVVAQLLPGTTLLADRSQDVYDQCDGKHYALVKARKDGVKTFIETDPGFRSALADRLGKP